jgi:cytochrome oxidase Cu insertion factor (SCO1/SenC/PrrC family)
MNTKYAAKGARVVVVDVTGRKELTEKVIADAAFTAPVLLDNTELSRKEYNVLATPTTYIVDPSGKMIFKHIGYGPGMEKMLEREIDLLLGRKTT